MPYQASTRALPLRAVIDLKGRTGDILPRLQRLGLSEPSPGRISAAPGRPQASSHRSPQGVATPVSSLGALELLRAGRAHWLLLAPLQEEERLLRSILEEPPAADTLVLAVSDLYQFFAIDGPDARQLMAIASPLDVDASAFPSDGATFTEAFGQKALLLRRDYGFDLAFERSYASMVEDYFSRINPEIH